MTDLKSNLRNSMTAATYDAHIAGARVIEAGDVLQLVAPSPQSAAWLRARLLATIEAAAGRRVEILEPAAGNGGSQGHAEVGPALVEALGAEPSPGMRPDSPDLQAARADLLSVYFSSGTKGYDSVPYEFEVYQSALLGPAYLLWRSLCAEDKRKIKDIAPNFWTPPIRYGLEDLASRVGRKHPRYVAGDALECEKSRIPRREGRPLRQVEDCCGGERHALLWFQETECGLKCKHWSTGLIEVLQVAGLMRVEAPPTGYKPRVQVWRLPNLLTPYQYRQLPPVMQTQFDGYLESYVRRYGLTEKAQWEQIEVEHLEPLMPGYDNWVVSNDWQPSIRVKFLANAQPNPNFLTCMSENLDDE